MAVGAFFAGIGGLELGSELALRDAGYEARTVFQIENDPFCQKVLKKHWPSARLFGDIEGVDAEDLPRFDLGTIGFPCTDISTAGRMEGLAGERSGLWYEASRILGQLGKNKPPLLIIENVNRGREGWLPYVQEDLEALGYESRPYCVAAAHLGAPHERFRTFLLATDADRESLRKLAKRLSRRRPYLLQRPWEAESPRVGAKWFAAVARRFATPPQIHGVDDGLSGRLDARRLSKVDPSRKDAADRIRAIGNAVSPPVAYAVTLELVRLFESKVG